MTDIGDFSGADPDYDPQAAAEDARASLDSSLEYDVSDFMGGMAHAADSALDGVVDIVGGMGDIAGGIGDALEETGEAVASLSGLFEPEAAGSGSDGLVPLLDEASVNSSQDLTDSGPSSDPGTPVPDIGAAIADAAADPGQADEILAEGGAAYDPAAYEEGTTGEEPAGDGTSITEGMSPSEAAAQASKMLADSHNTAMGIIQNIH